MEPGFTISGRIARPVAQVFGAVVDPEQLLAYFTTGGARGWLEKGATVTWDFHDFPGAFPVHVIDVQCQGRALVGAKFTRQPRDVYAFARE